MSESKTIEIKFLKQGYNPREVTEKDVAELAESIRQKGVLEPIIVRPGRAAGDYEVIAGHRRLLAAKIAKKSEMPCVVMDVGDDEAKEIAITENLHRKEVTPMEEAYAYAELVKTKGDLKNVALHVGQPVAYVTRRMRLLRLGEDAAKAFNSGELAHDMADVVADIESASDQSRALDHIKRNRWSDAGNLRSWVDENLLGCLARQPWLTDAEALKAVGKCTKCPPSRDTLFGKATADECVSVECWKLRMKKYLAWMRSKHPGAVLIAKDGPSAFGSLPSYEYEAVGKKPCEHAVPAIDVHTFSVTKVCTSRTCKQHGGKNSMVTNGNAVRKAHESPEAKAKRESEEKAKAKEREAEEKKADAAYLKKLGKAAFPPSKRAMCTMAVCIASTNNIEDVRRRHGIKDEDGDVADVSKHIIALKDDAEAWRFLFDLCISCGHDADNDVKLI